MFVPDEIRSEIFGFMRGDPDFQKKKNATRKILRWYRKSPKVGQDEDDVEYNMAYLIRTMLKVYDDDIMMRYPEFAFNKIRLYSSKEIETPPRNPTKRIQVIRWILANLDEEDMMLVGL